VYVGTHMANVPGTKLAAICDIFPDKIDNGKTKIPGAAAARAFRDYHELLAQPDIDAVLITTPVYLHPEHFEAAVKARKHIYCEKPAGVDVAGVKRLLKANAAADKSKTIQFGLQQRFSPEYLTAMEYARSGKIGPSWLPSVVATKRRRIRGCRPCSRISRRIRLWLATTPC